MSIEKMKKSMLCLAALAGFAAAGSASAQAYIVFDPDNDAHNFVQEGIMLENAAINFENAAANTANLGINTATLAVLEFVKKALTEREEGNMLDLTTNIEIDIDNIDKNITHIDQNIENINNITNLNYAIDQDFTWITHNYYGDDAATCPPDALPDECEIIIGRAKDNLAKLLGGEGQENYKNEYRDAEYYKGSVASKDNLTDVGFNAVANQKLANDALALSLGDQRGALMAQSKGLTKLIEEGTKAQGHGNQLQYANALAGQQAVQMAEMRSLMLAAESARVASAQASADKEARQVASKQSLRRSLDQASSGNGRSAPKY